MKSIKVVLIYNILLTNFLCVVIFLTCRVLLRVSVVCTSNYFSPVYFFEVEEYSLVNEQWLHSSGHCKGHRSRTR